MHCALLSLEAFHPPASEVLGNRWTVPGSPSLARELFRLVSSWQQEAGSESRPPQPPAVPFLIPSAQPQVREAAKSRPPVSSPLLCPNFPPSPEVSILIRDGTLSLCSARWLSSNALFLPKQKPSLRAAHPARWESMLDTGITDFMRCQVVAQSCLPLGVLAMEVAALCCCLNSVGHGFSVEGLVMIGDCPGEIGGGFPACAGLGRLRTPPHFLRVSPLLLGWTENTGAADRATFMPPR